MDDLTQEDQAPSLIIRRIPANSPPLEELPDGFQPLRLTFRPGRLCLELLHPEMMLGRHTRADIRLTLPDISRRHCQFRYSDGQWEVVDLNSLNGVYINGERLDESVLCQGDTLRIGSLYFVVDLQGLNNQSDHGMELEMPDAVLKSIAEILPSPRGPRTENYRNAS